ncbi:MAG: zf-HC2 domain-containing protein [Polyangiaceae bacterium]|nr:zf-HC2 domain-containing protein [Polyangiaceae bacterium]
MILDGCKATVRLLEPLLDGALDPVKTLEVEDHVAACEVCRERFALDRAMRGSLKKSVRVEAPSDVRARMLAALAGESVREQERMQHPAEEAPFALVAGAEKSSHEARSDRGMLRHWRTVLPLASAAALALAWASAAKQPVLQGSTDVMRAGFGNDELLRDFVAQHSRPLPPEQTDPTQVQKLERYVGVPVHVPHFTQAQNAHFVGGRLVPLHGGERAAMLQYELQQGSSVQRVTIFVYNPRNVQVSGAYLAPRAVGTTEVRVGQTDGYSVAVTQQGGVGYTIASDLDPESSAMLIASAHRD